MHENISAMASGGTSRLSNDLANCQGGKWYSGDPLRSLCPRSSRLKEIGGLGISLRSLWPTLHCRRVAGVSPLLSIGWWYISSVSPKRHCYRVSAAGKGCRVYPLDPRPDAVALYSGCTPASTISDPQPPTPVSDAKEKTKEQPSQAQGPRKDHKKTDLNNVKTTRSLKKKPEKNTSLKIARKDSLYESTLVSERSRRRKTFQASDDMDTDANLSDTDCVIDLTSEEYENLLEADFKQVADNLLTGPLSPIYCFYLPPNAVIRQQDLNNLVDQLLAPFVILGDFNGHSTLWGSVKTNPRGRQIEQVLSDHCLCLLNHEEPTYFHEPTRSFHTLDLAICSPSLLPNLNFSVEKDLYNSDHFPIILSHDYDASGKTFPPTYSYNRADWALFTRLAVISDAMVKTESVDTAVQEVTNVLIAAADSSIPKKSSHSFQCYKPWWNTDCRTAYKNQRKLWGVFRRYPTTENLSAFKKAKANARRVRRQRKSWIRYVSSLTSSTSSKQLWRKVKAANGIYREFSFPILQTSDSVFSSPVEIANVLGETFQSVSSTASYNSRFLEIKRRTERTAMNFFTRSFFPYNCDFTMTELKKALLQAHNTRPGPDIITYTMLLHLNPDSLTNILYLFNRV
ncbi:putative RNA-directed DNA polymerase from transposon X-element [Trichonephila clavipes]|nr:putative RNA-directed DNA polymerase from transposon X-element [Trichonephila clavipes]